MAASPRPFNSEVSFQTQMLSAGQKWYTPRLLAWVHPSSLPHYAVCMLPWLLSGPILPLSVTANDWLWLRLLMMTHSFRSSFLQHACVRHSVHKVSSGLGEYVLSIIAKMVVALVETSHCVRSKRVHFWLPLAHYGPKLRLILKTSLEKIVSSGSRGP